jgi:hypothetical protein
MTLPAAKEEQSSELTNSAHFKVGRHLLQPQGRSVSSLLVSQVNTLRPLAEWGYM